MVAYTQRMQQDRFFMQERLVRNCDSGMTLLKADPARLLAPTVVDLFDDGTDSVLLSKENWGFFTVATSKAFTSNLGLPQQFQQIALLAHPIKDSTALYLADKNKPLSLCGKTVIRGTAHLPRAGVKRAYINGQSYIGSQLIYGEKKRSKRTLPLLDLSAISSLLESKLSTSTGLNKQTTHSFEKEPIVFENNSIYLNNYELKGQILLKANTTIQVAATSILEDVILVAPQIIIENGFKGRIQAIASDSIIVGENCEFNYPSVLCLWDKVDASSIDLIHLGAGTTLNGALIARDEDRGQKPITIRLEDSTTVHGNLYLEGVLQLKGTVHGSVYTEGFVLKTASSVYDNHILSATIDVRKRSPYYLAPDFGEREVGWEVAAWLK